MITTMCIVGKEYPMSFSLMAAKKIAEKHGNIENVINAVKEEGGLNESVIDTLVDILELLIAQGCAYKNYFEKDVPPPKKAPIIDGKWTPLPREALELAVGISDMDEISKKIEECITNGKAKKIEAKAKNAAARLE